MKKRYAIIRVDSCPPRNEIDAQFVCFPNDNNCSGCRYGDTKDNLVRKVAQVRYKQELKIWWKYFKTEGIKLEATYQRCLKEAKEIVEFLGVK